MEQYIISGLLIESIIETFKLITIDEKIDEWIIFSLVVSMFFSIIYKLDMLSYIGFSTNVPFIGYILTGILVSRGSNFTHDIIDKIKEIRG